MRKLTIGGRVWEIIGSEGIATCNECGDVFALQPRPGLRFLEHLYECVGFLVPMHVSGSYPLWCMLGRPSEWAPSDLDVFLTHECPVAYEIVKMAAESYPGAQVEESNSTRIDVRLGDAQYVISLIFRRVQTAIDEFDLSAPSIYVPVHALWMDACVSAVHANDVSVFDDIACMVTRAHPSVVFDEFVNPGGLEAGEEVLREVHARMVAHLQKYRSRGFAVLAVDDPRRLRSAAWYHKVLECSKTPRFSEPLLRSITIINDLLASAPKRKRPRSE